MKFSHVLLAAPFVAGALAAPAKNQNTKDLPTTEDACTAVDLVWDGSACAAPECAEDEKLKGFKCVKESKNKGKNKKGKNPKKPKNNGKKPKNKKPKKPTCDTTTHELLKTDGKIKCMEKCDDATPYRHKMECHDCSNTSVFKLVAEVNGVALDTPKCKKLTPQELLNNARAEWADANGCTGDVFGDDSANKPFVCEAKCEANMYRIWTKEGPSCHDCTGEGFEVETNDKGSKCKNLNKPVIKKPKKDDPKKEKPKKKNPKKEKPKKDGPKKVDPKKDNPKNNKNNGNGKGKGNNKKDKITQEMKDQIKEDKPKGDGQGPKVDGKGPKGNGQGPKVDGKGPKGNGQGPKVDGKGPKGNGQGPKVDGKGPNGNKGGDKGKQ